MRTNNLLTRMALVLALTATGVGTASAQQSVNLNNFRQSETPTDDFALSRPTDSGDFQVGAHLHVDYANDPLVIERDLGDAGSEITPIVDHQVTGQFGLSLGLFNRLVLYVGLPVHFMMDGTDEAEGFGLSADGAGLGDIYFGGRVRLLGEANDAFALALQVSGTGNSARSEAFGSRANGVRYSGDDWLTVHPELLAEVRFSDLRVTLNAGYRIRRLVRIGAPEAAGDPTWQVPTNGQIVVNDELTLGLGVGYQLLETDNHNTLDLLVQATLKTTTDNFFERESSPLEVLGGFKYFNTSGFTAGIGGGLGVIRGYGAPDFRVFGMLGYQMPPRGDEPEEEVVEEEATPTPTDGDADGDGIPDSVDGAPNDAEDPDGFEDEDGIPDLDNDQDGVLDADDGAPNDAEDRDGHQDEDGVPDPDNDGDGVADADDRCPAEAEDMDGIQDADGCPETDADSDTILDADDHCPLTPGVANEENPECAGCPALACVDASGTIRILERVEFATNDHVILDRSAPVLRDVRSILASNNQIQTLRIEGHTDDRGDEANNLELSRRRGSSVRDWLVQNGIEAGRLEAFGCGQISPRVPNNSRRNRQENRRVEFHITLPVPADHSFTPNAACVEANSLSAPAAAAAPPEAAAE